MRRCLAIAVLAAGLLAGCAHGADSAKTASGATATKEAPPDPMEATRQGIHEGAYQLGDATDDLETAIAAAKALQASTKNVDLKAALVDLLEKLDDAGGSIADFTAEPPDLAEFKKEFDEQDKRRLDAIDAANDALHDIYESNHILDDFNDTPAPADDQPLSTLADALDTAAGDLTDAITAFGGKPEKDDTETLSAPETKPPAANKKAAPRPDL